MRVRCVSRFCVIVELNHGFNLLRFEKDRSEEAIEIDTHISWHA